MCTVVVCEVTYRRAAGGLTDPSVGAPEPKMPRCVPAATAPAFISVVAPTKHEPILQATNRAAGTAGAMVLATALTPPTVLEATKCTGADVPT